MALLFFHCCERSNQINIFINSSKGKKRKRNTTAKGMEGQK